MQVTSTRTYNPVSLSTAIMQGLAADGGLYVPLEFPKVDLSIFKQDDTYAQFAFKLLHYFFEDDALDAQIENICQKAFNFSVPLKKLDNNTYLLELFHGPTSSFKDFGARFLAECMEEMADGDDKTTILVATSGDTGSAVASAFYKKPHARVIVLFPKGKISKRQQQQIACWGDNVFAVAVNGSFDDCQRLVKGAYKELKNVTLSTANSINLGRLLPQLVYYAYTSWHFQQEQGHAPGFVVPSGNIGNVTACYWAQKIGFPIRDIAIATNANKTLSDYLEKGEYAPRKSLSTLANAMDVGDPSNFERLQSLFRDFADFKKHVQVMSVDDAQIEATIKDVYAKYGEIVCPHTATAFYMRQFLSDKDWIVVATAEAAKFETIVEPLLKTSVPISKRLEKLLNKEEHIVEINADMESLIETMETFTVE